VSLFIRVGLQTKSAVDVKKTEINVNHGSAADVISFISFHVTNYLLFYNTLRTGMKIWTLLYIMVQC
jgi:hypothetical protein